MALINLIPFTIHILDESDLVSGTIDIMSWSVDSIIYVTVKIIGKESNRHDLSYRPTRFFKKRLLFICEKICLGTIPYKKGVIKSCIEAYQGKVALIFSCRRCCATNHITRVKKYCPRHHRI